MDRAATKAKEESDAATKAVTNLEKDIEKWKKEKTAEETKITNAVNKREKATNNADYLEEEAKRAALSKRKDDIEKKITDGEAKLKTLKEAKTEKDEANTLAKKAKEDNDKTNAPKTKAVDPLAGKEELKRPDGKAPTGKDSKGGSIPGADGNKAGVSKP